MISSIEIENFQSHKTTILDFHEGVNIIKGRSHSGKSSVIRALKWALLNRPVGFHFKSHFSGKKELTSVAIEFDDGGWVKRTKGTGVNQYEGEGIKDKLEAIRSDVPDEISQITRMDTINVLEQGDPYFMLQETPGKVAKMLNTIVGLDVIDETMTKINSIISTASAKVKYMENDIFKVESHLESLTYLDDVKPLVDEIAKLITKYESFQQAINSLRNKIKELESIETTIEELDGWLTIETPFMEIKEQMKAFSLLQSDKQALKNTIADITKAETSLTIANETLDLLNERKIALIKSTADEFCDKCGAHQSHWRK